MKTTDDYKNLGRTIVKKLRDENFQTYLDYKEYTSSMTLDDYKDLPKNPEYDSELQKLEDDRFNFFNSLDEQQKKQLDQLILSILDATAFNFLRTIEENQAGNEGIGLIFDKKDIRQIYFEFLSGTYYGEYFLWLKKFSKFGQYQY